MNNPAEIINAINEPRGVSLASVVANPFLAFVLKYWHFITIFVLFCIIGTMGYIGFKYHESTTAKLATLDSQITQYQQNIKILNDNLAVIKDEMRIAREHRAKFDQEIANLQKQNEELRTKIRNIPTRIPANGSSADVQKIVDVIQNSIRERWENINNKSYIPSVPQDTQPTPNQPPANQPSSELHEQNTQNLIAPLQLTPLHTISETA